MRRLLMIGALLLAACATGRRARGPLDDLTAFARAADGVGLELVTQPLADGEPVERAYAAFALGQLGISWDEVAEPTRATAERALVDQLGKEHDKVVRDRIVEALGKLGGATATAALTAALDTPDRARAAVGLGLAVKSGRYKTPEPAVVNRLIALLDDSDAEVRFAAAYALFRCKAPSARAALLARLVDPSWLVRATAARALGEIPADDDATLPALAKLIDDADERPAAEGARALAKLAVHCPREAAACAPLDALAHSGAWRPSVAAAIASEPITHPSAVAPFAARATGDCALALAHDRALGLVDRISSCKGEARLRAVQSARALGEAKTEEKPRRQALVAMFDHKDAAVRAEVATALGLLGSHAVDEVLAQHLADENDPGALTAVVDAIAAHQVSGVELTIYSRITHLHGSEWIETMESLAAAAGVLGVRELVPFLLQLSHDPVGGLRTAASKALVALGQPAPAPATPPIDIAAPRPDVSVRLQTARGPIVIRLFGSDAPRTVDNFLKLVRAHFYDGLTFHRVVPDFVAQGGDPRGDGAGGPGWMIACEINQHRYREGTLAMALSGRDTGGSQFFIALSPQPHLDGRYTVFGEISDGLAVARALVEGDRILQARIVE